MEFHSSFIPASNRVLDYRNEDLEQQLIKQGYGDLVNANPWSNLDYKQSGWQKFLGAIGFRTGYDVAKENQQFQYNEYLSNIQAMATENEYNSPQSQVDRMRQAGMNPDLQGTGDVAGSAGLPEDTNNVLPNQEDSFSQLGNVVMSGISLAFGLAKDIGALKSIGLQNQAGELSNASSLEDLATKLVINSTSMNMPTTQEEYDNMVNSNSEYVLEGYKPYLSKRQFNLLSRQFKQRWSSLPANLEQYNEWSERMKSRQSAFMTASSSLYDDSDEILFEVSKILNESLDNARKQGAMNEESRAVNEGLALANEGEYMANIDPSLQAQAENASNESIRQNQQMEADLQSVFAEIVSMLRDKADHGSKFASIALIAFSVMRLMSVQRSGSTSVGPKGTTSTSGFSIGF